MYTLNVNFWVVWLTQHLTALLNVKIIETANQIQDGGLLLSEAVWIQSATQWFPTWGARPARVHSGGAGADILWGRAGR